MPSILALHVRVPDRPIERQVPKSTVTALAGRWLNTEASLHGAARRRWWKCRGVLWEGIWDVEAGDPGPPYWDVRRLWLCGRLVYKHSHWVGFDIGSSPWFGGI